MTKEIESAMQREIEQLPWMGDATKKRRSKNCTRSPIKSATPTNGATTARSRSARDDYFGNVERATIFESKRQLAKIGKPVDRNEWQMTPPTVNAYYDPQMNDINFPAGVLQPPLYDPKLDAAPNYGNTGATIGHELTHGFDDEGRQFDAMAILKDWWTMKDADEFSQARQVRLRRVFAIYDHRQHQDQRPADAGRGCRGPWRNFACVHGLEGRHQKSESAVRWTDSRPISASSSAWRSGLAARSVLRTKRMNAITNPHSPDEYRINGVVSNMPEFGAAFACRAGQPMVRTAPCRVW